MLKTPYSVRLTGDEAAFLFQMMEIPEADGMLLDFGLTKPGRKSVEALFQQAATSLETSGLLESADRRLTMEIRLMEMLKACRNSSASIKIKARINREETRIIHGFLSGMTAVELQWSSLTGEVLLSLLNGGLEELVTNMGIALALTDSEEDTHRTIMREETYHQLKEKLSRSETDGYLAILRREEAADDPAAQALSEACRSWQQWGMFQAGIRGTEIHSQPIHFIGSPAGHWLFIYDELKQVHGFQMSETELFQTLYVSGLQTLQVLSQPRSDEHYIGKDVQA